MENYIQGKVMFKTLQNNSGIYGGLNSQHQNSWADKCQNVNFRMLCDYKS